MENLILFLHEFWVQILTVVFMIAVIVAAVILGHKVREAVDKKKSLKGDSEKSEK